MGTRTNRIGREARCVFAALALAGGAARAAAEEGIIRADALPPSEGFSPVSVALAPAGGCEYPSPGSDVGGLRISLSVGRHRTMNGLDVGVFGNWADGELNGLSIAGLGTWCGEAGFGFHLASAMNYCEGAFAGGQMGLVNSACSMRGLQLGVVNATSDGSGVQVGVWNMAEEFRGLQVGLCNISRSHVGVQLGLGNIIGESPLTACLLLNAWF